jgi:hypothetical protein
MYRDTVKLSSGAVVRSGPEPPEASSGARPAAPEQQESAPVDRLLAPQAGRPGMGLGGSGAAPLPGSRAGSSQGHYSGLGWHLDFGRHAERGRGMRVCIRRGHRLECARRRLRYTSSWAVA